MGLKEVAIEMRKEVKELKEKHQEQKGWAIDILSDYKKANERLFIIILVMLVMWFLTIGYLVYVLNDIGVEETTTSVEQSDAENNNYIGNNGVINNGDTKDKDNN